MTIPVPHLKLIFLPIHSVYYLQAALDWVKFGWGSVEYIFVGTVASQPGVDFDSTIISGAVDSSASSQFVETFREDEL